MNYLHCVILTFLTATLLSGCVSATHPPATVKTDAEKQQEAAPPAMGPLFMPMR